MGNSSSTEMFMRDTQSCVNSIASFVLVFSQPGIKVNVYQFLIYTQRQKPSRNNGNEHQRIGIEHREHGAGTYGPFRDDVQSWIFSFPFLGCYGGLRIVQ